MGHDRTEFISGLISLIIHATAVILFSFIMMKSNPRQVALITDVTLIDVKDYMGSRGEEEKVVGTEKKQKEMPKAVKKTKAIEKDPQAEALKLKEMLRKIEKEKAKLEMGISRENLRDKASENESYEDAEEEVLDVKEVVAGGKPVITGAVSSRKYKDVVWRFPEKLPEETELAVEIIVLPAGFIKSVKLARTSGYPELDRLAISQARKLVFEALPAGAKEEEQLGVLLFKFGAEAKSE